MGTPIAAAGRRHRAIPRTEMAERVRARLEQRYGGSDDSDGSDDEDDAVDEGQQEEEEAVEEPAEETVQCIGQNQCESKITAQETARGTENVEKSGAMCGFTRN